MPRFGCVDASPIRNNANTTTAEKQAGINDNLFWSLSISD
jgi:hypothetical protein